MGAITLVTSSSMRNGTLKMATHRAFRKPSKSLVKMPCLGDVDHGSWDGEDSK